MPDVPSFIHTGATIGLSQLIARTCYSRQYGNRSQSLSADMRNVLIILEGFDNQLEVPFSLLARAPIQDHKLDPTRRINCREPFEESDLIPPA